MKTVYQYIKENNKIINNLYKNHIIPRHSIESYEEHTYFLDCLKIGMKKAEAIERTVEWFGISQRKVYRNIEKMTANLPAQ